MNRIPKDKSPAFKTQVKERKIKNKMKTAWIIDSTAGEGITDHWEETAAGRY